MSDQPPVTKPAPVSGNAQILIDKVGRIMRDRGDLTILMAVDRLMDLDTEQERTQGFAKIVRELTAAKAKKEGS